MTTRKALWTVVSCAVGLALGACSSETGEPRDVPGPDMSPGDMSAASGEAPGADASPTDSGDDATGGDPAAGGAAPTDAAPGDAEPSDSEPGDVASGDGEPSGEPMEGPTEEPVEVDEFGCALDDPRVSRVEPCHDDPDPCGLQSGFSGDQYCILPPPEGEGIQIHIGPDNYDDEAEYEEYVIYPGEEFNNSVLAHIPLDEEMYYYRMAVSMRPGSHHWIGSVVDGQAREGFYEGTTSCAGDRIGSLAGGQNLVYDNPPHGIPASENEGLGSRIPGNASACINLHSYNVTDEPQMRELWFNLYRIDEADITQRANSIGVVGGLAMNIPPGASEEISYTMPIDTDGRIIQLFGHRHAWTPRFAVWINDRLIYDSWDWVESRTFNYDSITDNPPIDTEAKLDGAVSGPVYVEAGDELTFTCFVENESDVTLTFRNSLYEGEMCNLWGRAVGPSIRGFMP